MWQLIRKGSLIAALAAFTVVLLTACGGGGSGDDLSSTEPESTVVRGSVGDGPITGATVNIYNVKGELVRTGTSDNKASYRSRFKTRSSDYPLFLKVSDGIDLVTGDAPDFELVSVMMDKSNSTANINPFSTLIVKMAENMAGGVNADNINYANHVVMEKYSFGLDPNVVDNPVTKRITSQSVAHIVKASEALGEMIRRTRDVISATGNALSCDDVVDAIAADMADGFLDGMGASGSDPTIAAVANVVSGQVLVETLTNNLKVNGVVATTVIDQAIKITHSSDESLEMSGSVRVSSGLLEQTKQSLAAARVVDSSSILAGLAADIENITVDSSAADASRVLSTSASQWLDNAVTRASTAGTQNLRAINQVASTSLDPGTGAGFPDTVSIDPVIKDTPLPVVKDASPPVVEDATSTVVDDAAPPVVDGEAVRVTDNLVAFYPFVERSGNVVRDLSSSAVPMDLIITGAVTWYGAGNGVVMNGGRVGTTGPATELINTLRASNSSSFEVWVEPGDLTQSGPSRMVSVGNGWAAQNFMLGQAGDDVEARLLHTGKQTMIDPKVRTDNGVLDASLVHLVHTYDGAVERLYINGVQHDQTAAMSGGYGNWDMSHVFSIGNEASSDRPYNGVIRLVAVYDRPLGLADIQQNYAAGPTVGSVDGGVEGANYVPVITGTPAKSAATGEPYDFQPAASDADGDTLVFSITGQPEWTSFDTTTGRLSGIPGIGDVGTYSDILITVTDGTDEISLGAFSIQVSETVQVGTLSLSWSAPTLRSDGTPLSPEEISGYRIHYGEYEGDYTESVNIANGKTQSVTLKEVPVGGYYVAMTAYDVDGRESSNSASVFKVVQ